MKKRFLVVLTLLIAALFIAGCGGRNAEFGYVDVQKVMTDSPKIKELQDQMDNKVKELESISEKEKTTLSAEEFKQKEQLRQSELMSLGKELENQFKTSLDNAMQEVTKEKKLGAVLVKGSVLHGGIDVTDDVIKRIK